jgi:hypothetical protein
MIATNNRLVGSDRSFIASRTTSVKPFTMALFCSTVSKPAAAERARVHRVHRMRNAGDVTRPALWCAQKKLARAAPAE